MAGSNEASLLLRIKQLGGEVLDHFVVTLGDVMDAIKKTAEFLYSFVEAYHEQEIATNRLSQAMVNQGMYTTDLRKKYEEQATALQKVTQYADEQIISAQAQLQAAVGNREVSEKLTKATLDLAAAKRMDLASAADLVAKSISKGTTMLSRYGVVIEDSKDKSVRMANVIEGLNKQFHGQAEAAGQGLGAVQQMKNAFNDFQESVGKQLAPLVELAARALKSFFEGMSQGQPIISETIRFIFLMADQVQLFGRDFQVIGSLIGNVLGGIAGAVGALAEGKWKEAWTNIKSIATVSMQDIEDANKASAQRSQAINDAYLAGKGDNLKKEEELEAASRERRSQGNLDFDLARAQKELEETQHKQDMIIQDQMMQDQAGAQRIATQIKIMDKMIQDADSYQQKKGLVQQRGILIEQQRDAIAKEQARQREALFQTQRADIISASADFIAAVGDSESKAVFYIQKAAALATTWMLTQVASAQALASIPYPANLAAAANVETIGYIKMATIAATAIKGLATGGIVSARQGGTPFILGEGGRDEAVIPLDDPGARDRLGGGGGMTVIFQGPILGNDDQADKFAKVLDRAFLRLRQSNQSLSFDSDVF